TEGDYAFVSGGSFLAPDLAIAIVPGVHTHEIYRGTTIINNTYVYNSRGVINNGVPVAQIAARTNRQIEAARIADAHFAAGAPIRGEVRTAGAISVYRPAIVAATPRDPQVAAERGLYVRRTFVNYPRVTAAGEHSAQARLQAETAQRRNTDTIVREG